VSLFLIMVCSNARPIFADVGLRDVMDGIDLAREVKMRGRFFL